MVHLFAENFTVPVLDTEPGLPEPTYDEERSLSLDLGGNAFVERGPLSRTDTLTEVRGEQDDPKGDIVLRTETITKVQAERPDIPEDVFFLGTETRQLPPEREDRAWGPTPPSTESMTKTGSEDDELRNAVEFDTKAGAAEADGLRGNGEPRSNPEVIGKAHDVTGRAKVLLGTETAVRAEASDFDAGWAETFTFVRNEGTDSPLAYGGAEASASDNAPQVLLGAKS
jgi:hypothetical protein